MKSNDKTKPGGWSGVNAMDLRIEPGLLVYVKIKERQKFFLLCLDTKKQKSRLAQNSG